MKLACMMAGAVIAFSAGTPQIVLADTVVTSQPEIRIETAADFIRTFLTEKVTGKDGKETEQTITAVTDKNYVTILAARDFLDKADPKLKKDIETELEKQKIDWKGLMAQAEELQKKLKPESADKGTAADPGAASQQPVQDPTASGTTQEPQKPETAPAGTETKPATGSDTVKDPAKDQPASGTQTETGQNAGQSAPEPTAPAQTPATDSKTESQTPADKTPAAPAEDVSGQQGQSPATEIPADNGAAGSDTGTAVESQPVTPSQPEQPAVTPVQPEEAAEQTVTAQPETAEPEVKAQTPAAIGGALMNIPAASTPQAQTWTAPQLATDAASSFISSWLTSAQGNLYGAATSQNQLRILGAMRSWNALSASDKAAVNTRLQNTTGKTFQQLVREAQQLRLGKPVVAARTRVHTAAQDQTGFFTGILVGSLTLFVLLADKMKRIREEAA